jgi:hypothetical protein
VSPWKDAPKLQKSLDCVRVWVELAAFLSNVRLYGISFSMKTGIYKSTHGWAILLRSTVLNYCTVFSALSISYPGCGCTSSLILGICWITAPLSLANVAVLLSTFTNHIWMAAAGPLNALSRSSTPILRPHKLRGTILLLFSTSILYRD